MYNKDGYISNRSYLVCSLNNNHPRVNMTYECSRCGKTFTRSDNYKRHKVSQHKVESFYPMDSLGGSPTCGAFQLQHPFTCMVVGMTGSGKTVWVKNLLEHAPETIAPPPQRIVWCYSQWQPTYTELAISIPQIEFVRGIPAQLEQDSYFDVNVRNLIVIDDQMIETGNDNRIAKLFTKGSHHRNLSVIFILQNLFHQSKVNRSISLNSHYLVLFKNPRDKMQVMMLAKQMYPRNANYFLDKYEEAVERPYGYLFVDLKPTTSDQCRLRTNVLPGETTDNEGSKDDTISKELLKYLRQQNYEVAPEKQRRRETEEKMNSILHNQNMGDSEKVIKYTQLQNEYSRMKSTIRHDPFQELRDAKPPKLPAPQPMVPSTPPGVSIPSIIEPDTIPYPQKLAESPKTSFVPLTPPQSVVQSMTPHMEVTPRKLKKQPIQLKNMLDDDAATHGRRATS